MKNERARLSPLAAEMAAGMAAFCDALESGEPIERRYTVRTITLDLEPADYTGADVRRVRDAMGASQTLLARFLGVSAAAVRAWEQGTRKVPKIARRFLDEIVMDPQLWKRRMLSATEARNHAVRS